MRRFLTSAVVALVALLAPAGAQAAGQLKAGVAEVDGSWHVGASAGQYASDGSAVDPSNGNYDPTQGSTRRSASYGIQSRLRIRAIVVEGPNGNRMALVKNDLYLAQDLLWRRTAQLLAARGVGIDQSNLTMAVTHNHSSPYYSSTAWGVWTFQDVFDIRFYNYYAERMADAVEKAAKSLVPVRVGASVSYFDKTHRHSFGPSIAADGTPAGYPQDDTDHDMSVVRFDDISNPGSPKPLANLVNFSLHPEFLDGNDLISEDYLGPLERMTDKATGAMTIYTQAAVGTSEPERSTYHPVRERLEFSHKEYGQAEYGARLMSDVIADTSRDVERATPEQPERFVPFRSSFEDREVAMRDQWFPGPVSHPYPGVSNCRTDSAFVGDPQIPVVGLPTCQGVQSGLGELAGIVGLPDPPAFDPGIDPGINTDDLQRLGVPVPENYSAPAYTGLEEDVDIHLQAFRLGDILFTVCSCEQWSDQAKNIETRTDRVPGNEYLGYDWKARCRRNGDGTYGTGPEGFGTGTWTCPNPAKPTEDLPDKLSDEKVERMYRQVTNPANGWNDVENATQAESEPADLTKIKGNYTHDDRCGPAGGVPEDDWNKECGPGETSPSAALGYKLTIPIAMANDYNGYIATYREYQRGDHYRKALTAWGPHSSDYMASRLVNLGRVLNGGDPAKLVPDEFFQAKVDLDLANNDARAQALGESGSAAVSSYEARLPDDGGKAGAVKQPGDLERFGGTYFSWVGGSNYTDNPRVRVQRRAGGDWREWAGQSGELPVTIAYPQGTDAPSYESGSFEWRWTAHFEAFAARFETIEGTRSTPPGEYRFVVNGERREGKQVKPYRVVSKPFIAGAWSGIDVEDLRTDPDGRVSFRVGPRAQRKLGKLTAEIGPIDYPDTYTYEKDGPLPRFIENNLSGIADPEAPDDPSKIEWFCTDCTFRPWIDFADAQTATVTIVRRDGSSERVDATEQGGRWRTSRKLREGEAALVGRGCVRDAFGDFNGVEKRIGSRDAGADASCRTAGDLAQLQRQLGTGSKSKRRCGRLRGRLRGRVLGRAALGRKRKVQRRRFPSHTRPRKTVDRFCLVDGRHIRVGYPGRRLLVRQSRRLRPRVRRRAVLVLTSSQRYSIRNVRNGSTPRFMKRRMGRRIRRSYRVGRNRWYVARGKRGTNLLFKVTRGRGRVGEIGIADARMMRGRLASRRFLSGFK